MEILKLKVNDYPDDGKEKAELLVPDTSEQSANSPLAQQLSSEVVDNARQHEQLAALPPKDYGPMLNAVLGSILAFGMLIPLFTLPGLILIILPAEVYLIGQIYDNLADLRSEKRTAIEHIAFKHANEENEKVRVRVYGTRTAA